MPKFDKGDSPDGKWKEVDNGNVKKEYHQLFAGRNERATDD